MAALVTRGELGRRYEGDHSTNITQTQDENQDDTVRRRNGDIRNKIGRNGEINTC